MALSSASSSQDGEPERASCYFKDIDGNVPDRFELISAVKVS